MLVFYAITPIIYIFQFHKILKGRERERERESQCQEECEIGFSFRCIWSKPLNNTNKAWYSSALATFGVSEKVCLRKT